MRHLKRVMIHVAATKEQSKTKYLPSHEVLRSTIRGGDSDSELPFLNLHFTLLACCSSAFGVLNEVTGFVSRHLTKSFVKHMRQSLENRTRSTNS